MPRTRLSHLTAPASAVISMPGALARLSAGLCTIGALTAIALASAAVAPPVPARSAQAQQGGGTTQSSDHQLHQSGSGRTR